MASESGYSQANRQIAVTTPLGDDVLLLRSATITERLSHPFECDLELLSEDDGISPASLLGESVTVRLDLQHESQRFFNGLVSHFSHVGFEGRFVRYRAKLVPWLWLLTRTSDCRIFPFPSLEKEGGKMTALDVVKEIFDKHGFPYDAERLSEKGSYRKWEDDEICVQYRETDFNFVNRLMENEGIYFFFEHEEGKHTLVLADSYGSHEPMPGYEQIPYHARDLAASREQDFIFDWSLSSAIRPGAFVHDAFDFKNPSGELRATSAIARNHAHADLEIFDYPGEYVGMSTGERYATVRMQELQAEHEIVRAQGYARGVAVGNHFELRNYPREDQNREYLILSAQHHLKTDEFQTDGSSQGSQVYQSSFTAIDAQEVYRPLRLTPKPIVQGPQTAIVVGEASEEITTDEYGRVKVQFHWDRYGNMDQDSSCFIRVSNDWAGKNWGAIAIPRIGQEVVVSFLEGDPDRPLITGRVYNDESKPPFELPGKAVISGVKTNSTKGGGGYNELSMDDTKGTEKINIHGQYDMVTTVEHDDTQTIHNNRTIAVDGTHTETIVKDTKITTSEGTHTHNVKGAVTETYDNKQETTVANEIVVKSKGSHIHVTAATEIKLEVGASTILMKSDGTIKIDGVDIAINGVSINIHGVSVTSQADADHNTKGAIVLSEGAASNTVKGGMVMLNP